MITDPAALLASANCLSCYGSDRGTMSLLKLALLNQIAIASGVPVANLTPAALLSSANCLSCYGSNADMMMRLELALLLQIATNGSTGGGGSAQLVTYTSGTPANPANINSPALAYDPNGVLPILNWNTSTHVWV